MTAPNSADGPPVTPLTLGALPAAISERAWPIELLRYFLCSALALGVDLTVFSLAISYDIGWATAAAGGFTFGLLVAYFLSIRFAFAHRSMSDARLEFALFALSGILGLALTQLVLWVMIVQLEAQVHASKLLAAGFVFVFNFTVRKLLLFRHQAS
jgi:putative flippase GtrA